MNRTATIIVAIFALIALGYIALTMTQGVDEEQNNVDQTEGVNNIPEDTEVGESGNEGEQARQIDSVNVYVVELEAGEIGCGDAIVPIERNIEPTTGVLMAALNELFGLSGDDLGEDGQYYNALQNSDLSVESAVVENGVAAVEISGDVSIGGICDDPRFEEQIRQTALQFDSVDEVNISVNGTPLAELFDEQGV